jgi:hypothetical protein
MCKSRFVTSSVFVNRYLNSYYYDKSFEFPPSYVPSYDEWESLILDWVHSPLTLEEEKRILETPVNPNGYVDSWYSNPIWGGGSYYGNSRHYDTNAHYILGIYRTYAWTKDLSALRKVYPQVHRAMQYQLQVLDGTSGLLHITLNGHTGLPGSATDNYYDLLPFEGLDAYTNVYFYASLKAMQEIETVLGDRDAANYYDQLAIKSRVAYMKTFWNAKARRYIEDINVKGQKIDYGATFVNLEAAGYGLTNQSRREAIYHWLDDEPVDSGGIHAKNAYAVWGFIPMVTTIDNKDWYVSGWTPTPFTTQLQNGGGDLYLTFYDVMDRISTFGPNNAWKYLMKLIDRFSLPDQLSGGSPLLRGVIPEDWNAGAVGVDVPFPESGLPATSFLYGFLGINATIQGLQIQPDLPSNLTYGGVQNLYYGGHYLSVMERGQRVQIIVDSLPFKAGRTPSGTSVSMVVPKGQALLLRGISANHPVVSLSAGNNPNSVMAP